MNLKCLLSFLVLLPGLAFADNSPGDFELSQSLQARQKIQQLFSEYSENDQEKNVKITGAVIKAGSEMQGFLASSARSGHPVAQFYLAQLFEKQGLGNEKKRAEYCRLLDEAAGKGLLAAAVVQIYKCDESFRKFEAHDREHLRMLSQLAELLGAEDANKKWYPLPLFMGMCFPPPELVKTAGSPIQVLPPRMTSYTEFRGEASLLLALLSMQTYGRTEEARKYVQQAESLDCPEAGSFKVGLLKDIGRAQTSEQP